MHITLRSPKVLSGLWRKYLTDERQAERERKRIARCDNIRDALMVLEALRNWNIENERSKA
jgi:hypothetical protein